MKVYKTLMALGLAGLLTIPSFVSAKQKITRDYATKYLGITQNSLTCSLGYCMHTNTYHDMVLFTGVKTGDVKISSKDGECNLEGSISTAANQDVLNSTLKEVDKKKPYGIIEPSEALDYKRGLCAEYKTELEKVAALQAQSVNLEKKEEKQLTGKIEDIQAIEEQPASDTPVNMYGYNITGKETIKWVKALVAPNTNFIMYKDQGGKDRCKLDYTLNDLNNIDQKTLEDALTKIDAVGGDKTITQEEAEKYQKDVCRAKKKEQDSKKEPKKQESIEEENLEE